MTTDVDAVQERVLQEILTRNGEAEYLANKCGLAGATDRAGFRAKVPMVEYEDLEPYIRRIANGDRSPILTGPEHPVTELFTSSGTSGGERKLIPSVEDERERRRLLESLTMPVVSQCCLEMEEALNWVYREGRVAHGSIGPLEIRVVRMGTFEELADLAVSRGVSVAQYKVPRCVTAPVMIHLLDSHVISTHFSPAMPHWAPDQRFQ
ncbi:unnamed protein product [Urochloa humidicola]